MTRCLRAREELLDARLAELSGDADTELSRHVRECGMCGAAARTILEATEGLDAIFDASLPPLDVQDVIERARFGGTAHAPGGVGWRRWTGLAAAAVVGGLLIVGDRERPLPGQPVSPRVEAYPTVEIPADRNVVVIPTANPEITVLWFF